VHDFRGPGPLAASYDPNKPSTLPSCSTCKQRRPPCKPDGWGKTMDWWDCWPCPECDALVCNMPVFQGKGASCACYVQHIADCHPELYARAPDA
jgi:hypothetical protein